MFIFALVLFATNTFSTPGHFSKASSTIPFKSIDFFPLKEPSAVITILQSESLILVAKAVDEKPAKTTECIAPILAQANKEIANSGIIGT